MSIACIANNGSDGSIEVPFYDCPCAVCTKMEWDIREEESETLAQHRHTQFPEHWDAKGVAYWDERGRVAPSNVARREAAQRTYTILETAHPECSKCEQAVRDAASLGRAVGSREVTVTDEQIGLTHSATVRWDR